MSAARGPDTRGAVVLGIETSCDETAAAVVLDGRRVRSNVVASQHELHRPWRGVVPELASRAHAERIGWIVERALDLAGVAARDLTGVAVTARPGLLGALLVGTSAAKALAWAHGLPIADVDHIAAHVYSPALDTDFAPPYVALVASGGHTALYHARAPHDVVPLGATRDDAAGEAFDKVAKLLDLPYPGGPEIDRLARAGDPTRFPLPRPTLGDDSLDFSFSGLKTAVLYALRGQDGQGASSGAVSPADVAASFQTAVVEVLVAKLERASDLVGTDRIAVAGGVACNAALRAGCEALARRRGWRLAIPIPAYCTDNAAMIAGLGYHALARGEAASLDFEPRARIEARRADARQTPINPSRQTPRART